MKTFDLIGEDLKWNKMYSNKNVHKKIITGFFVAIIDSSIRSLVLYRIRYTLYKRNNVLLLNFFRVLNGLLSPIQISEEAEIEGGCHFPHTVAIVIGKCKIGKNAAINQGVTIGLKREPEEYPLIKDNVQIGAGAKVLGNVEIGSNSIVGANAVVINLNVPENSIAVGIPAKVKKLKFNSH
jgi:serine O-acetyltransferase